MPVKFDTNIKVSLNENWSSVDIFDFFFFLEIKVCASKSQLQSDQKGWVFIQNAIESKQKKHRTDIHKAPIDIDIVQCLLYIENMLSPIN